MQCNAAVTADLHAGTHRVEELPYRSYTVDRSGKGYHHRVRSGRVTRRPACSTRRGKQARRMRARRGLGAGWLTRSPLETRHEGN